jgi:hypothetical protein
LKSASGDIADLRPQLDQRAQDLAQIAKDKLAKRGEREEADLLRTLQEQRQRVREELIRKEPEFDQLVLDLGLEERRQLETDMKSWRVRLEQFEKDMLHEPKRVREFYTVQAIRVEPVGLVYLWPESN